jgi:hypothetical protein
MPSLPIERDGGPITATGAAYLSQLSDPLRMTRASWTLVMEAWHKWNALCRPRSVQRKVGPSTPSTLGMGEPLPPFPSRRDTLAPLDTTHRSRRGFEALVDIDALAGEGQNEVDCDPFDAVLDGFVDEPPYSARVDATERHPAPLETVGTRRSSGIPGDRVWADMERRLERQARDALDAGIQLEAMAAEVGRLKRAMELMVQAMDEQMELRTWRLADVGCSVGTVGSALREMRSPFVAGSGTVG